jgi:hypothetical protein
MTWHSRFTSKVSWWSATELEAAHQFVSSAKYFAA